MRMIEGIKTKQNLFNYIARHLLNQREQSRGRINGSDVACKYFGPRGLRCSIGCLVDEKRMEARFEGESFTNPHILRAIEENIGRPIRGFGEGITPIPRSELAMLMDLRKLHDDHDPMDWWLRLVEIAKKYRLKLIPELQEKTYA
jgi:hypothetical protein